MTKGLILVIHTVLYFKFKMKTQDQLKERVISKILTHPRTIKLCRHIQDQLKIVDSAFDLMHFALSRLYE